MNNSIVINLFISYATLLSGDPTDCIHPTNITDDSCGGGLASVAAVIRHSQLNGDGPGLYIPTLDRVSKFVQMHPLGWGVNHQISHTHFAYPAYFTAPSLFSSGRDVSSLKTHMFAPIMTNVDLPPTSPWSPYLHNVYFDIDTSSAYINVRDETQPLAANAVESLRTALDYVAELNEQNGCYHFKQEEIRRSLLEENEVRQSLQHSKNNRESESTSIVENDESGSTLSLLLASEGTNINSQCAVTLSPPTTCWSSIVLFNEPNQEQYTACLQAALEHENPPLIFYDLDDHTGEYGKDGAEIVNNTTVVFHARDGDDVLSHLRIEFVDDSDSSNGEQEEQTRQLLGHGKGKRMIKSMKFTETHLYELPLEYKDEAYVQDQVYLRTLADQAIENDPIVGYSNTMPFTRIDDWRMCMGGECPIGNLFTDAMRWATDADFSVTSSGGLRGPGWDAGPVHVGDLWTALPFSNYMCTGVMSGVSIFRMLNYSTAMSTFESTYTPMGDRLLQMSGMRMTYNTLVSGEGLGRLMAVEVYDKETKIYQPIELLKLYKFATDSWNCGGFDPYPSFFGSELQIKGEVPGSVDSNMNVQSIVGDYLSSLNGTHDTSIQGRLVNDTEAFEPMDFIQSAESCGLDYYWDQTISSCIQCPGGKYVTFSDDMISFTVISDDDSSEGSVGRNILSNRQTYSVTIVPKSAPSWVVFQFDTQDDVAESSFVLAMKRSLVLEPGQSVAIDFGIDPTTLATGSTRSTVSYGMVIEGEYPGCLTDLDITFDVLAEVRQEENLNQIDGIRPVGLTLMAISMALSIFFAGWTFLMRDHRVVKSGQPTGCIVLNSWFTTSINPNTTIIHLIQF